MIILKDFITFLKRPYFEPIIEVNSFYYFLKLITNSFIIVILIQFFFYLIISVPLSQFLLLPVKNDKFAGLSIVEISLILPILEELIFRLPLRPSKFNIVTPICLVLFVIINKFNFLIALFASLFIYIILLRLFKFDIKTGSKLYIYFTKHFKTIFYFLALVFGSLHLLNFNLNLTSILFSPLIIAVYFVIGCFLAYVRVRFSYGIYAGIIVHIMMNSFYSFIHF